MVLVSAVPLLGQKIEWQEGEFKKTRGWSREIKANTANDSLAGRAGQNRMVHDGTEFIICL